MNLRQKKKHDYFFDFIPGLEGYPRHKFVKRRGFLFTKGFLRKLYKNGEYFQKYNYSVFYDPNEKT